ncbi:hypothetical protein MTR67_023248 [Solanum verrucosum]|uniref:Uncharacterized protein n=1 Tax=Solanum verrucosum TaxID=315347 RepID=A0AAF0QV31_SOLVR|nr:hypothetical protein MTR67_023248 [Solanum verrucosum]
MSLFACSWNPVQLEIQFSVFSDGLTVRTVGPWFVTEKFRRNQSENFPKSRLTDRPTVRRSDHGPWSMSVDRHFPYPASDTNYGRQARIVIRSTVCSEALSGRLDRRTQSTDRRVNDGPSVQSVDHSDSS